jgi:transposase-like protein
MQTYLTCPSCREGASAYGTKYLDLYKCRECNHVGCFVQSGAFSFVGCWKGKTCPSCGESNRYEKVGYVE